METHFPFKEEIAGSVPAWDILSLWHMNITTLILVHHYTLNWKPSLPYHNVIPLYTWVVRGCMRRLSLWCTDYYGGFFRFSHGLSFNILKAYTIQLS